MSDAHECVIKPPLPTGPILPPVEPPSDPWRAAVLLELRKRAFNTDADRFALCGQTLVLRCSDCSRARMGSYWCERKICPGCARRRAAATVDKWMEIATAVPRRPGYRWVLLTLTLQPSGNLRRDYRKILDCWRKLLRRWRRWDGVGGFRSVEVGAGRNVHIHTLAYLPYVPQGELSDLWQQLSGSRVVDIRAVKGPLRDAMQEVGKYVTKWTDHPPVEAVEIYEVFKGAQPFRTWGVCFGTGLCEPQWYTPCESCGCEKWWPDGILPSPATSRGPPN